jgi:hypothetical protein
MLRVLLGIRHKVSLVSLHRLGDTSGHSDISGLSTRLVLPSSG